MNNNQDNSIEFFLKYISDTFNIETTVIDQPDKTIRNSKACDSIATIGKKRVAIEHTSIDSYPKQREEGALFLELFVPIKNVLEKELKIPGRFVLCTDSNINLKRFNFEKVRPLIINWCLEKAGNLEIGSPSTAPRHFISEQLPGIPFKIKLYRWQGQNGVRLSMNLSEEIEIELIEVLKSAMSSRGKKVVSYKEKGFKTILLLESNEIQLLNDIIIREAFCKLTNETKDEDIPDEVYLIMSGIKPYELFCLKFGEDTSFEVNNSYKNIYNEIYNPR